MGRRNAEPKINQISLNRTVNNTALQEGHNITRVTLGASRTSLAQREVLRKIIATTRVSGTSQLIRLLQPRKSNSLNRSSALRSLIRVTWANQAPMPQAPSAEEKDAHASNPAPWIILWGHQLNQAKNPKNQMKPKYWAKRPGEKLLTHLLSSKMEAAIKVELYN